MTMLVSLLQLMGFPAGKPVHSRAEENTAPDADKSARAIHAKTAGDAAHTHPVQELPARRSPVKAQAVKHKATAKKAAVAVKSAKAAQPAVKTKVAPKALAKPLPVKPPVKKVPAKVLKTAPVKAAKPVLSPPKKKPESVSIQTPVAPKQVAPAKPASKSATPEFQMTPSGVPVRTGRPSSRLVQLTVPSMAQSVASTAAKSSFTQMAAIHPIVPPLASATKRDPKLVNNWKTKAVDKLTDEEIMAMSDNDYMNDTQMAFFRLKLVALKNDILSNAGETTEHLREDTVVVPDPADRATIEEEHALELRTRDRERKLLKKIEQSIDRIDAGDYGFCDETGEPIGVGRLLARPTATLSLEAQQRRELKQKMFGD